MKKSRVNFVQNKKLLKFFKLNRKKIFALLIIILISVFVFLSINYQRPEVENSTGVEEEKSGEEVTDSSFDLSIAKIGITAPIITGVDPDNDKEYNAKLKEGVLLMPGTALPGETGNVFIYGHSSALEQSDFKEIFAKLNDLSTGDEIKINYKGTTYLYFVSEKKIVAPTDFSILEQTDDRKLTLMTCWPIGSDEKRLAIIAKIQ